MRDLDHYIDLFDDTDTVGSELLARAIYAAHHGDADDATPDDLRPIIRGLPESVTSEQARELVAAQLLRSAAEADDPKDAIRRAKRAGGWTIAEMAAALGVARQSGGQSSTLQAWLAGDRVPGWESRKKMRELATTLDDAGGE